MPMALSTPNLPKFYNAWFCPFAQRAWIALLEKKVNFEYVEQNPYNKTPEWLAINPRGMVPVIVHKGKSVYESMVCIEYVDEEWSTGNNLLPSDPYHRARARILCDHISKKVVPPFYQILMKKAKEERDSAKKSLVAALSELFSNFDASNGPYFGGKSLGIVDIMIFPFAYRFGLILPHYRNFVLPEGERLQGFHQWYATASKSESVVGTMPDDAKLIEEYRRYAEDTTDSLVAQAVRKGSAFP